MPFIPTVDAVRVAMGYKLFNQTVINTLWFSWSGGDQSGTSYLTALASWLANWYEQQLAGALSPDITLDDITVTTQDSAISPSIVELVGGTPGSANGVSLPSSDCLCVSFRTGERGRSARGRNYVSGIPSIARTGNTVNGATITIIEDSYNYLVNNTPTNWNWIVVSHVSNGVNRAFGLKQSVTSATIVDPYLDKQGRRGTGRGV